MSGSPRSVDNECNGLDEDCDGRLDEDFTEQPLTCGEGQCERDGVLVYGGQLRAL